MSAPPPTLAEALFARARRDLAGLALVVGGLSGLAMKDPLVALPQSLAAAAVLLVGARAERLRLPLAGRLALLAAAGAYAWLPAGDPPTILARFLSGIAGTSLLRPKAPREHGFVILLLLLQTSLAAALSLHWTAAPAGVLLAVLFHRAVGSWHRQRSAARAAAAGGPLVRGDDPRRLRRSADVAALTAILVAAPIFLVLPRTDVPLLRVPGLGGSTEPGVGEEVRLGRLGPLSDADQVVGRVAPRDADARDAAAYFRAVALEAFDGTRWSGVESRPSSRAAYDARSGTVWLGGAARSPSWLFVVDAAASPRLPLPERATSVVFEDPVPGSVRIDAAGTVRPAMDRPSHRWVYAATAGMTAREALAQAPPSDLTRVAPPSALRDELAPAVAAVLARAGASPRQRAERLTEWVRSTAAYDLFGGPAGDNPVGDFLFRTRRGHCEHFASALAMALREAGIPSRLVAGYHALRWNEVGGFWVLRRRDAHAWVEAWIDGEGWARFDATPASAREADPYEGVAGFLARLRDAAAFAWNRTVLGYDRDTQRGALEALRDAVATGAPPVRRAAGTAALVLGAVGLCGVAGLLARRRRRARVGRPRDPAGFYGEALRRLRRLGIERGSAETPAELADRVVPQVPPPVAAALAGITAGFLQVRYGGGAPPDAERVSGWLADLSPPARVSSGPSLRGE